MCGWLLLAFVEMKKKKASNSQRIYYEHLIPIFFIFFEIFSLLSGNTDTTIRWEHYMSTKNTFENEKQANPLSYKDGWSSNHVTSCKILLQCICKLWYYSMSQSSFSTSFFLSLPLVGLLWMLTNHWAHQEFSHPLKKYSYEVEPDIFLLCHSSINHSIYCVWVLT